MTLFVVMSKGVEYNDETYSIGGEGAGVHKQSFATLEAAREFARKKLEVDLARYRLYDFEDYFLLDGGRMVADYCMAHGDPENSRWGGARSDTWKDLIEWADEHQIDWAKGAPEILEIVEIQEPD